ncbi:metallo-mystery pair system four-Cys motif protein [Scytonema sp. NUACC21]
MQRKFFLVSTTFVALGFLSSFWGITETHAQANGSQEVTIQFRGMVGDKPFSCGENYAQVGQPPTTVTATDFRFYVSDVALIDDSGKVVPLKLTQDGKWQYQNVALLDFENKSGACANGTSEVRDRITGTIPKGNYKGLKFTLGVPFQLNHEDATLASSPLNLTSLWWSWNGGYKFVRIDLRKPMSAHNTNVKQDRHGGQGFAIHIGSTGCQAANNSQKPTSCSNPNTSTISFANFDPNRNVVVADLKALLASTNLETNQANTGVGCMSDSTDKNCAGIMANFGIPFNGNPSKQTFFQVK